MCGIAGLLVDPARGSVDVRACLSAVSTAMAHRGPDDQGLFVSTDGRVGLVNQRLAVVDLSPAGHMPMRNAEGTLWITHNGEIYNAAELRAELESRGPRFRSTSDTEVILRGYEAWGPAVVPRLRGMFAFAIYEERGAARAGSSSPATGWGSSRFTMPSRRRRSSSRRSSRRSRPPDWSVGSSAREASSAT